VPELVAATGSGSLGGFTLFQVRSRIPNPVTHSQLTMSHSYPPGAEARPSDPHKAQVARDRRGTWGVVALGAHGGKGQRCAVRPSREPISCRERLLNPRDRRYPVPGVLAREHVSSLLKHSHRPDADPGQFGTRNSKGDITITTRVQGVTVGASSFFQGTAILHVLSNAIRVLEPGTLHKPRARLAASTHVIRMTDGTERQIIKDMEGNNQRPKIKYCSICDPFVFILREDDTIGLFIGEPERGKIRRKDMSPMGEKVRFSDVSSFLSLTLIAARKTSRYIAGSFFNDTTGMFKTRVNENAPAANGDAQPATSTLQAAMTAGQKTQWLMLCRPQSVVEVCTLSRDAL
jgi:hypothetical protein